MDEGVIVVALMALVCVSILAITQHDNVPSGEVTLIEYVDSVNHGPEEGFDLGEVTGDVAYVDIGAPYDEDDIFEPTEDTNALGQAKKGYGKTRYGCTKKCFCTKTTCRCTPGGCFKSD